jgi:MFS family permease
MQQALEPDESIKNIYRFFYSVRAILSFWSALIAPFWVVFFKEVGLSYTEISLLIMVSYVVTLIFEVPTGAVADLWGRKLSVIISLLITGGSFIGIFLFFDSFPALLVLFALQGFGGTFISGAFSAWVADSLISSGAERDLTKYWGGLASGSQLGSVVGFLIGSALVFKELFRHIWLISGLGTLLTAAYIIIKGRESSNKGPNKNAVTIREYIKTLLEGSIYLFKRKNLFLLTLASFFWYISTGILSLTWQPYLVEQEVPKPFLGGVLIGYTVLGFLVARKAGALTRQARGERKLLWFAGLGCGGLTLLMIAVKDFSWVPFVIYGGVVSLKEPVFQGYLNKFLPTQLRATILSSHNMITSISTILSMITFGATSDRLGLLTALILSAIIMFVAATTFIVGLPISTKDEPGR